MATDPLTGAVLPLLHPLQQNWHAHFVLTDEGRCLGITAVGRATVEALAMNADLPRMARFLQVRSGLLAATNPSN
ncbi:hypothetical protein [Humisphaera borealis]|nr:hypothetical protein [Humisphaera borealis]